MSVLADKFAIRRNLTQSRELLKKERTDEIIIEWISSVFARQDKEEPEAAPIAWKPFKPLPELNEKELMFDRRLRKGLGRKGSLGCNRKAKANKEIQHKYYRSNAEISRLIREK